MELSLLGLRLSPAQDHRLFHGGLGELVGVYSKLDDDGVVVAVTPRHCEVEPGAD